MNFEASYLIVMLTFIFRNHFARAIIEYPSNPLRSPFATSFLATYRSSIALLRIVYCHLDAIYLTVLRAWDAWALLLSSAVRYRAQDQIHLITYLFTYSGRRGCHRISGVINQFCVIGVC